MENFANLINQTQTEVSKDTEQAAFDQQWTEKYAPKSYMDLITDENTNLQCIQWLKSKSKEKTILLLSGPTGTCKSSLARVIGKEFNILELGHDRQLIKESVEAKSIHGQRNLVIIDEIDQADRYFVFWLIKLKRPLICICNDLWASSLKPLRQHCLSVQVRKPSDTSIVKRLQFICHNEGVAVDRRALTLLVERSEGDFRNSLNVLEFLHRNNAKITVDVVKKVDVGHKDKQLNVFAQWERIFTSSSETSPFQEVDDMDLIVNGCFEHYPKQDIRDTGLWGSNIIKMHEHFALYEQMQSRVCSAQSSYDVMKYQSLIPAAVHYYCATARQPQFVEVVVKKNGQDRVERRRRIEFPMQEFELRKLQRLNIQLYKTVLEHSDVVVRQWIRNEGEFAIQLLSYLCRMLTADVRGINISLLKPNEHAELCRVAKLMMSHGLQYLQEKTETGNYIYRLDPPLDSLVTYISLSVVPFLPSSYAVRQMIVKQLLNEGAIKEDSAISRKRGLSPSNTKDREAKLHKRIAEKAARDYFGRVIDTVAQQVEIVQEVKLVRYRYHEGYSNAVRRKLTVSDLLK